MSYFFIVMAPCSNIPAVMAYMAVAVFVLLLMIQDAIAPVVLSIDYGIYQCYRPNSMD